MWDRRSGPNLEGLASFIRQRRTELGLTQTQLGERLVWEQVRVSRLERAKYGLPSLPLLASLADSLEVSLSAVLAALGYADVSSPSVRETQEYSSKSAALLYCLEQLLAIPDTDFEASLHQATQQVAQAMGADAVLAYFYEPLQNALVLAVANSPQLAEETERLGLARLPLGSRWTAVKVFETGEDFVTGHADSDRQILSVIREDLHIRSILVVPIMQSEIVRGVLTAGSMEADRFSDADRVFLRAVAHWIGLIVDRSSDRRQD